MITLKKVIGYTALTAIALLVADPAFAGGNFDGSITEAKDQLTNIPSLISAASYVVGAAVGVAGIASLKKHVDNPGQEPIKNGLGRLAAAGAFVSLPMIIDMVRTSTAVEAGGTAEYTALPELG